MRLQYLLHSGRPYRPGLHRTAPVQGTVSRFLSIIILNGRQYNHYLQHIEYLTKANAPVKLSSF